MVDSEALVVPTKYGPVTISVVASEAVQLQVTVAPIAGEEEHVTVTLGADLSTVNVIVCVLLTLPRLSFA